MKKAYAIIIRNGLILFVRRPGVPIWELPGGLLYPKENERTGMQRLIDEELGLENEVQELVGIYTKELTEDIIYVYKAKETETQKNINSPTYSAVNFFDIHNLPLNIHPDQKQQIKDYLSGNFPMRTRLKTWKWMFRIKNYIQTKRSSES
ncbi:NUDIX domain-containing protein [Enterococcus sp. 669A]|uniref:NUDIX domain-containing protein n=1 Tax=Candidatus Enterococcus moelleringii TaxID=2815325 RepID=A0ABS3LFB7_9ENTE|nr:NUDIX domain-containing protein [Enterococcus sp. 669A]MBO1308332.1 NUDIX domain-containing protein [Enterococcus sp. 669A]